MFNAYTSMPVFESCDCEGDCGEDCKCKKMEKPKWPEKPQDEEKPHRPRQYTTNSLD